MKTLKSLVQGAASIDPNAPSLFMREPLSAFTNDEVKLAPPRDFSCQINDSKRVIESGKSIFLEISNASTFSRG